tara:strand:- start:5091 stop:5273 length:183 start_codon:yes stop_codon:yes gene_type:complete
MAFRPEFSRVGCDPVVMCFDIFVLVSYLLLSVCLGGAVTRFLRIQTESRVFQWSCYLAAK